MRSLFLAIAFSVLAALAVAQAPAAPDKPAAGPTQEQLDAVPRITVDDFKALLQNNKDVVVIDARSPGAWRNTAIEFPGAIRVPPMEAPKHLAELEKYQDRPIVTYCS